ncbi:MAG: vWA domain-containing protein [Planctomycetota bacterium]
MTTQRNWSGSSPRARVEQTYQWQSDRGDGAVDTPRRKGKLGFLTALVVTLVMLGTLIATLPYSPDKTPCFAFVSGGYQAPFSVNGWAEDDLKLLKELDGENLAVHRVSPSWNSVTEGLDQFSEQLALHTDDVVNCGSAIVYLNTHGLVNDQGIPCVLPLDADPHDTSTWVPIDGLLDRLREAYPETVSLLVVVDCARVVSDWDLGVAYNAFAERLGKLIDEKRYPNLTVMASAGDGERAWSDSNFALRLLKGLAGAADGYPNSVSDSRVTTSELFAYVRDGVQRWSTATRGVPQVPVLMNPTDVDFEVTIGVASAQSQAVDGRRLSTRQVDSPVTLAEITELWSSVGRLTSQTPILRLDPIGLRDVQQDLVRLEQLHRAGPALAEEARESYSDLKLRIQKWSRADWTTLAGQWEATGQDQPHFLAELQAHSHSIPVAQWIGAVSPADANRLTDQLDALVASAKDSVILPSEADAQLTGFSQHQFLRIAQAADVLPQWPSKIPFIQSSLARRRSEEIAVPYVQGFPDDLRAHFEVLPMIDAADEQLRQTEDALWIGGGNLAAFDQRIGNTANLQENVSKALETYRWAYTLSDLLSYDLALIGQWLSDDYLQLQPDHFRFGAEEGYGRLADLVDLTLEFDQLRSRDDDPEVRQQVMEWTDRVTGRYGEIRQRIAGYVQVLVESPDETVGAWHELRAIQRLPFLSSDERQALLAREQEIRRRLQGQFEESDGQDAITEEGLDVDPVNQLLLWSPEIASRFLLPKTETLDVSVLRASQGKDQLVDSVNNRLRRGLLEMSRLSTVSDAVRDETEESDPEKQVAESARRVRRAASFSFKVPESDVLRTNRVLLVRRWSLWMASRALNDCWGGGQESNAIDAEAQPYFTTIAQDYVAAARSLKLPLTFSAIEIETTEQRLTQQSLVAISGLMGVAEDVSPAPGLGDVEITAQFAWNQSEQTLPAGTATLFLRAADQQRIAVEPVADDVQSPSDVSDASTLDVPLQGEGGIKVNLAASRDERVAGSMDLVAFYRGLEFVSPFTVRTTSGNQFTFTPETYDRSRVTLFGDARQQSSIVFILDCSASMGDPVPGELLTSVPQSKLEVAKSMLSALLNELGRGESARVGVRFFGHRLGWSTTSPLKLLSSPTAALPADQTRTPSTDVEEILPLGRFDSTEAAKVDRRLDEIIPWGQSPLHLAILESMEDFVDDDLETDRGIVVITDGVNYQFTPSSQVAVDAAPTGLETLLRRLEGSSVPINILGFGVAPDERSAAAEAFNAIAEATGGRYQTVDNGRDLLEVLQSRLGLGRYRVSIAQENQNVLRLDEDESHPLNRTVSVPLTSDRPTPANVSFQASAAQVEFEGGEWLQLRLAGNRIESIPYIVDSPITEELVQGRYGDDTNHVVRIHRPRPVDAGVEFTVSLQSLDRVQTKRPEEVWLEVTPIGDGQPSYHFYDAHFQPDTPVPVLTWMADNWPQEIRKARVRFWAKPIATPASFEVAVQTMLTANSMEGEIPVPDFPGVRFRYEVQEASSSKESCEVRISEFHQDGSIGVGSVKLDLVAGSVPVSRVTRYFDHENGIATHSFRFDKPFREALLNERDVRLVLTRKSEVESSAWQMRSESVLVEIVDESGVFPLDAAQPELIQTPPPAATDG